MRTKRKIPAFVAERLVGHLLCGLRRGLDFTISEVLDERFGDDWGPQWRVRLSTGWELWVEEGFYETWPRYWGASTDVRRGLVVARSPQQVCDFPGCRERADRVKFGYHRCPAHQKVAIAGFLDPIRASRDQECGRDSGVVDNPATP